MNKASVRNQIKLQRRQLSSEFRQQAAQSLFKQFQADDILAAFQHIAVYLSHDNEIELTLLIQHLWQQGKHCYLPVLHPQLENTLCFMAYTAASPLYPNKYGILEPEFNNTKLIEASQLDAVLMPLIAFDQSGHRLGTGGGYYDRSLAFVKKSKSPLLIGCAYQFQFCDTLPNEAHDVGLNIAVTEQKIYHFKANDD
ncbi:MAG: 5-formyltetrahydrofolate cyclo-ligase [Gammaproteobacteria bacterium]|jgi:5-formyltetrahydrofolate cyclo-ligase|nr:5-formyltetrahydrofolate cyclo-ligase [Gammaproteobacteria bacterium]